MARVRSAESCETAELVSAYLDGQLQPGELDLVVRHLGECVDCITEFHQLKEVRAALRTADMDPWPMASTVGYAAIADHMDAAVTACREILLR